MRSFEQTRAVEWDVPAVTMLLMWLSLLAPANGEAVDILRDTWGIPHIYAASDAGCFYGLGYATAEDRGFQLYFQLRMVQGRLAEVIGDVPHVRRRETSVQHDRKMRTFGFYRAAQQVATELGPEPTRMLRAYCDGVNDWFREHENDRHPFFEQLQLQAEPWTPADCIASWWHMGQFFATDGTRDLIAWRNRNRPRVDRRGRLLPEPAVSGDDSVAIVQRGDVSDQWIRQLHQFQIQYGLGGPASEPTDGAAAPKFSHAWVVGGVKTTTGAAVLVSDPQTPVTNPSLFYEFHLHGKSIHARGIGVPGSPILLIGFSPYVAWGATALGADQADLFRLDMDEARANQYRLDGKWHDLRVWQETIRVQGGQDVDLTIRESLFGPLVTPFAFAGPDDGEVALKRVPSCDRGRETIVAGLAMMRAKNVHEFDQALADWRFPSANLVFGDREGNIGYRAVGAIPVRSANAPRGGRWAHDGSTLASDWQTYVPPHFMPHVINPQAAVLFSGNHRPIESFYAIPLGNMTGSQGDTLRSWRLRELLSRSQPFAPLDVLQVHFDTVNPARREIVRLGLHIRDFMQHPLADASEQALDQLQIWLQNGAKSDLREPGAALATQIDTFFRFVSTDLALEYGGGLSGLARYLKSAGQRIAADPQTKLSELEIAFVDRALSNAWSKARQRYGNEPQRWTATARREITSRQLPYYQSLDGYPVPAAGHAISVPALTCVDGSTINSNASQAYTQFVDLADVDRSRSILPPGQSERFDSKRRTSTIELWEQGRLHPAPLSRAAVEKITVEKMTVERNR